MKHVSSILMAMALFFGLGSTAMSQERATREEAVAMTTAAIDHIHKVGPAKAYDDFTHDKANWTKKDLYVMVYDAQSVCLAHGANDKLVGKNLSAVKDANGKAVVLGLQEAAAKGGGWFDYDWPHPISKKIEPKTTFAKRPPSGEGFVAVGIYR